MIQRPIFCNGVATDPYSDFCQRSEFSGFFSNGISGFEGLSNGKIRLGSEYDLGRMYTMIKHVL